MSTTEEQGPERFRELLGPEGRAIEAAIRISGGGTIKHGQGLKGTSPQIAKSTKVTNDCRSLLKVAEEYREERQG